MLFIEYPKCTTCKKAKKWLEENEVKFEDRDIKEMCIRDRRSIVYGQKLNRKVRWTVYERECWHE